MLLKKYDVAACATINGDRSVNIDGRSTPLLPWRFERRFEELKKLQALKTGALIKCSALLGVIAAEGTQKQRDAAESYAENLGHAFQIVDDILDVIGDEKELGKPIGSDADSNKSTYVTILGIEQSQKCADELTKKAIDSLDLFSEDGDFLKNLAMSLVSRKN